MPNWCDNTVRAPKKILDLLYDKKTKTYTMNTLLPVPAVLEGITSGTHAKWVDTDITVSEDEKQFLLDMYGATDWYDWQNKNRGVKWDFSDPQRIDPTTLSFDTAWGPPIEFFEHLSGLYPADEIKLEAHEGGCGLHALFTFTNGGLSEEVELDDPYKDDDDDDWPPEQDPKEEEGDTNA